MNLLEAKTSSKNINSSINDVIDIDNIDEANNEISNLYIGSIKAKLQILKKIGN